MEPITARNGNESCHVRVVHDTDVVLKHPGVDTIEGWACPLIFGETMLAQSVEMPAGISVPEHPEPVECMVYTVRGHWVLSVGGEKHLMSPGSLHWLDEGAMAGCEVPFDEPALVVNFIRIRSAKGGLEQTAAPAVCVKNVRVVARNV